jgi:hypothetical protein
VTYHPNLVSSVSLPTDGSPYIASLFQSSTTLGTFTRLTVAQSNPIRITVTPTIVRNSNNIVITIPTMNFVSTATVGTSIDSLAIFTGYRAGSTLTPATFTWSGATGTSTGRTFFPGDSYYDGTAIRTVITGGTNTAVFDGTGTASMTYLGHSFIYADKLATPIILNAGSNAQVNSLTITLNYL